MDFEEIRDRWVGKETLRRSLIDVRTARLMQALLDETPSLKEGDELPHLWHWPFFGPETQTNDLGDDGHPELGGELPDLGAPRRMWAAGKLAFTSPIVIGDIVERRTKIESIEAKSGSSGMLYFLKLLHTHYRAAEKLMEEEQTLVYRQPPTVGDSVPAKSRKSDEPSTRSQSVVPSTGLLFRYSALTFNTHRIHYDREYAKNVEGYPALVVHGQLIATLLLKFWREVRETDSIESFSFRSVSPLFDSQQFNLCESSHSSTLWATNSDDEIAMTAKIIAS